MSAYSNKKLLTILLLMTFQIQHGLTLEQWQNVDNNMEYGENEMEKEKDVDSNLLNRVIPKLVKKMYPAVNNFVLAGTCRKTTTTLANTSEGIALYPTGASAGFFTEVNPVFAFGDTKKELIFHYWDGNSCRPVSGYLATHQYKMRTKGRLVSDTSNPGQCSCQLNFQPIDLGRSYFPRYIQTGSCQADSCEKHYDCIERKYVVKVLKRKDLKISEESSSITLPKTLRDFWDTDNVPVTVACDCIREIQMVYQDNM